MWMALVCRYLQFSGIAIAVAHEITHGFDDEGYSRMFVSVLYARARKVACRCQIYHTVVRRHVVGSLSHIYCCVLQRKNVQNRCAFATVTGESLLVHSVQRAGFCDTLYIYLSIRLDSEADVSLSDVHVM